MDANTVTTLPAGAYRIGDPGYSIPDDVWGEVLEGGYGALTVRGEPMAVFPTMYGDGLFADAQGREYPVDSSLLGAVAMGFPNLKPGMNPGITLFHEVVFSEDAQCYCDSNGDVVIGDIRITTSVDARAPRKM